MVDDFMKDLESEAADLSTMPTDAGMTRLRRMGVKMVELERTVEKLKEELTKANVELYDIQHKHFPDLMSELNTDKLGLPDYDVDLVMVPYAKANIAADWEDAKREAAFTHLEQLGAGDLIKNQITVTFGRGEYDNLLEWVEKVRGLNLSFDPPELVEQKTVPWNTLTSYVKEQVQAGTEGLDLEKLGATVGLIVKTKKRN